MDTETTDRTGREHPIIFSGEMVRAILEGRKTQTRRVIKGGYVLDEPGIVAATVEAYKEAWIKTCPYGHPGDMLWVREGIRRKHNGLIPDAITYTADDSPCVGKGGPVQTWGRAAWGWKANTLPPRFMPRWASRITLEITGLRVERIQDITDEDVVAEGLYGGGYLFMALWDSINAKRGYGWESNPFVLVITFKVIEGVSHD